MYRGHWTAQGVAALGRRIYEERIREEVEPENDGKALVVDVTTGGYVVHDEEQWAFAWARERYPDGVLFLVRVGRRAAVSRILARQDPMGLVASGAPADEYEPEARTIEPRLAEAVSLEDMRRIAREEFARWFDEETAGPETRYESVAGELWELAHPERRNRGQRE